MSLKESALNKMRESGAGENEVSLVSNLFDDLPPDNHRFLSSLVFFSRGLLEEPPGKRVSKVARLAAFLAPHSKEFKRRVIEFLASETVETNFFHARKHNRDLRRENALDVALHSLRIISRVYNESNPVKENEAEQVFLDFELVFNSFLENKRTTVEQATRFLNLTSRSVALDLSLVLKSLPAVGLTRLAQAAKKYKSVKEIVLSAAREELDSLEKRTSSEGKFAADREDRIAALRSLVFGLRAASAAGAASGGAGA